MESSQGILSILGRTYKSLKSKRFNTPKANEKLRSLGISVYEDKLVQGVMASISNEIYEPRFLNCSYGFRPNKNCHDAISSIKKSIMTKPVNYILDADIKGFFDNADHKWLIKFLENDIEDKNFIRYIVRFLKSGIMEKSYQRKSKKDPTRWFNIFGTSKRVLTLCIRYMGRKMDKTKN